MTKSLLAAVLILFGLMLASVAFAHVVDMPPIVKPPVVTPPVVTPPVTTPPVAPAQPATQPGPAVAGGDPVGPWVFVGVAAYFWAAICVVERRDYPDSWFSRHMCFKVK